VQVAVAVKTRLLALSTRVAPVVAAMTEPVAVQQYLLTEMRRELNDLTRGLGETEKKVNKGEMERLLEDEDE
jgi:hypothetical protein